MQFIGSLFTSALGGGAAGLGSAASLSSLQTTFGVIGAIGEIGSGFARASQLNAQAAEQDFAARDEYIRGRETSAALKAEMAKTLADQSVAFAAAGVDLGSVSVEEAKRRAVRDAERELGVAANESLSNSLARRRAARNLRSSASAAIFSGLLGAGERIAGIGMDRAERGLALRGA